MTRTNIARLYKFITKMILLLEKDLEILGSDDKELKLKRNITSTAGSLITMLTQLNKLDKEDGSLLSDSLSEEDLKIIQRFVKKYAHEKTNAKSPA